MKKKIPLAILEVLQPIADENLELIKPVATENAIFHLVDKDPKSDLYFKVINSEKKNGHIGYYLEFMPKNKHDMSVHKLWVKINEVNDYVINWIKLISGYNQIETIYDDPILKHNANNFFQKFELVIDGTESASFSLDQQLFLEAYLETCKEKIESLKAGKNSTEIKALNSLKLEAEEIKAFLTKENKKKINSNEVIRIIKEKVALLLSLKYL